MILLIISKKMRGLWIVSLLCGSLWAMDDDVTRKYSTQYKVDTTCFKHFAGKEKPWNRVREFDRDFYLRNTPFEGKSFNRFDTYMFLGLLYQKKEISKTELPKELWAPHFAWEKFCFIPRDTVLKSGHRNCLQDYSDTQKGLALYDIPSGQRIFNSGPVVRVEWAHDATCCVAIKKTERAYEALVCDIKNNKYSSLDCALPGPDGLSHFVEYGNDLRFVTHMDKQLHITHIRPEYKTRILSNNAFSIVKCYFNGPYVWIHYKNNQNPKIQDLILYDTREQSGYVEMSRTSLSNTLKYIFDPYGCPEGTDYTSFCVGDTLYIYDCAKGQVIYTAKQKSGNRLIGIWNSDGTLYAVSDTAAQGYVTVHDRLMDNVTELEPCGKEPMIADVGFQGSYVGVSSATALMVYDCYDGRLIKKIPLSGKSTRDHGFCAPQCVYVCSDDEVLAYNFIEYEEKLRIKHIPGMRVFCYGPDYCGCALLKLGGKELVIINLTTLSTLNFNYDRVYDFAFISQGDRLMVAHETYGTECLDIIDTRSGKIIATVSGFKPHAHKFILAAGTSLCAMLLADEKTVLIYDTQQPHKPLKKLEYKQKVAHICFDEAATVFVVTTNKETYAYCAQDF